ncbi:Enhancer of polycomb-like protein 1 [Microbotryomycetes sp. JL201]|nr:Enhancer of polycomb-like protein 1 [Microbotryomycetes sp. JL201]
MSSSRSSSRAPRSIPSRSKFTIKTRMSVWSGPNADHWFSLNSEPLDKDALRTVVKQSGVGGSARRNVAINVFDIGDTRNLNQDGVDRDEENELHLKRALTSSFAKMEGQTQESIPLPSASIMVDRAWYETLYCGASWSDPHTYIRFSDTVERSVRPGTSPTYTMDEQDETWLVRLNQEISKTSSVIIGQQTAHSASLGQVGENEFECLMDAFEMACKELQQRGRKRLPAFADLYNKIQMHQSKLPRPTDAGSDSAYTCFRPRQTLSNRRTRKSDETAFPRLLHLRRDLSNVQTLFGLVLKREQLKLQDVHLDRQIFEEQVRVRALKRKLGESSGDEQLLLTAPATKMMRRPSMAAAPACRDSLYRPSNVPLSSPEELRLRQERPQIVLDKLEYELRQKTKEDQLTSWTDMTNEAFETSSPDLVRRPESTLWRRRLELQDEHETRLEPVGSNRARFRRRMGRGGKVWLDRIGLHGPRGVSLSVPCGQVDIKELKGAEWSRVKERWKYDNDSDLELDVKSNEPNVLDDFCVDYTLKRVTLLGIDDLYKLTPDPNTYLRQAFEYVSGKGTGPPISFAIQEPEPCEQPPLAASLATSASMWPNAPSLTHLEQVEPERGKPDTSVVSS